MDTLSERRKITLSTKVNGIKPIADLPAVRSIAGDELFLIDTGDGGRKTTASALRSYIGVEENVITVSGATPTITGAPNTRYVCGEVTSLSVTPPSSGTIDVVFTSGSTVTVLTLPNTVKMPEWFEIETNRVYELSIMDGVYGAVMSWAL